MQRVKSNRNSENTLNVKNILKHLLVNFESYTNLLKIVKNIKYYNKF